MLSYQKSFSLASINGAAAGVNENVDKIAIRFIELRSFQRMEGMWRC